MGPWIWLYATHYIIQIINMLEGKTDNGMLPIRK